MSTEILSFRSYSRVFRESLDPALRKRFERVKDLEDLLEQCLARVHDEHPQIILEDASFIAHIGARLRLRDAEDPMLALEQLRLEDMYLALACAQGEPHALKILEEVLLPGIRAGLIKLARGAGCWLDDFMQEARLQLLVPAGERRPKILKYGGQGKLFSWLNVVLRRDARHWLRRNEGRDILQDNLAEKLTESSPSPERLLMRESICAVFAEVLRETIKRLEPRARTLLSLHVIDDLSFDQIGVFYGVHRTTAMRWIERIKQEIHLRSRSELTERLKLQGPRLDSTLYLLQSDMHISLGVALGGVSCPAA